MGKIDPYTDYYDAMKVTKKELIENICQLGDHRIGNRYRDPDASGLYTLVKFDLPFGVTLVSDGGIARNERLESLDDPFEYVERGLPWLTWRYGTKLPYIHGPLSNFWIEQDGLSLEHRFAAAKTHDIHEKFWILSASTPGAAKKRGRNATLRSDWEDVKRFVLRNLLVQKFATNYHPYEYLIVSTGAYIREKNNWNDTHWGVNLQGQGRNLLGKELMLVREVLNG